MTFVDYPDFSKKVSRLLDDESLLALMIELAQRPDVGALIRNGGGIRKVRWAATGHGKSGGVRVIYYWATLRGEVYLLDIFPKNKKENLTATEVANLRKQVGK